MGKNSSIEWTDHTFNPWWGCVKISPACANCYAEAWAKRVGKAVWGPKSPRRFFGHLHWQEPLKWNVEASKAGQRRRVFCASMADIFEPRFDLDAERAKLWQLIEQTPLLDWLLLTKRPGSIGTLVPWRKDWPANVWLGTTVENQQWAEKRLPNLLRYPAAKRFLSCEPLLGQVDLSAWLSGLKPGYPIDWVIAGGESGPGARPMMPGHAKFLRDQCSTADVPFHFKQWGHWAPIENGIEVKGAEAFWDSVQLQKVMMQPVGKKEAGRELDGLFWNGLPAAA